MFNTIALRKTCAKHVSGRWVDGGVPVHSSHRVVVESVQPKNISPMSPSPFTRFCTQIVHSQHKQNNGSNSHFSAVSTGPTTTTTIYINTLEKEGE
jgi:hypothetical protein